MEVGEIQLTHIFIKQMAADGFIKPLTTPLFHSNIK